jgi:two-component system sensor histidine kinase KdpD
LHGPFVALYVEGPRSLQLSERERDRIADALRLAQALGGDAVTIPGSGRRIADDVIAYARQNNITQLAIGKSSRSRWFEILYGSVVHDLVRRSGNISVHVVAGEAIAGETLLRRPERPAAVTRTAGPRPYAAAVLTIAAAVVIGTLLWPLLGIENVDLLFLAGIVGIAVRFGLWPSLFASVVAALCYNFFFTEPFYTFIISNPAEVLAVGFFTVVAMIVSNVAGGARLHAVAAMARARTTESLYTFSRKLAGVGTLDDVLWAAAYQIALMLKVRVVLLLPENGSVVVKTGYPPEDTLDDADLAAARWAWQNSRPAGRGSETLPGAKRLFLPMRTDRGAIGIIGLDSDKAGPLFTPDERRLLEALIDQSALAIERVNLVEDMSRVQRTVEAEHLRSALLTSISHDLKTPLAAVLGAAGALRDLSTKLTDAEKADLLATIIEESERLNRFIANLLDMTRLESGAIAPKSVPQDVREIVGSALRRADKILGRHRVILEIADGLPTLDLDAVLFEQVIFNLLDNASKYAPPDTTVTIRGWRDADTVVLQILDEGEGIPAQNLEHIFDKFYRIQKVDQVRAGTGLGLAISRGFVEAMQGTIIADNRKDRSGAVFTIRLPVLRQPSHREAAA